MPIRESPSAACHATARNKRGETKVPSLNLNIKLNCYHLNLLPLKKIFKFSQRTETTQAFQVPFEYKSTIVHRYYVAIELSIENGKELTAEKETNGAFDKKLDFSLVGCVASFNNLEISHSTFAGSTSRNKMKVLKLQLPSFTSCSFDWMYFMDFFKASFYTYLQLSSKEKRNNR